MMHYEPTGYYITPEEQRKREKRYKERIALALARYETWKAKRK